MEITVVVDKVFTAPCGEKFGVVLSEGLIHWQTMSGDTGTVTLERFRKLLKQKITKCDCSSNCYAIEDYVGVNYVLFNEARSVQKMYRDVAKFLKIK